MNKKSYNYRKDYRTDEEFKRDIKSRSKKEKFLIEVYSRECKHRGTPITYKDNGVDNSGKVIKGKTDCRADFVVTAEDTGIVFPIDVKNSPVAHRCTFKVYNLEKYVENLTYILLFYNTGDINYDLSKMNYDTARFALLSPTSISILLNNKKDLQYSEPKFGGKICVKIFDKEYDTYFESHELTYHKG